MSWPTAHPYAAAAAFIGFVLIVGAFIVESRTSVAPGDLSVWGGSGAPLLNPTSYTPETITQNETGLQNETAGSAVYIPPTQTEDTAAAEFDFDSFLASLVEPPGYSTSAPSAEVELAYSFIPQGLVSGPPAPKPRTPEQQKLFAYGNEAGSHIQSYEDGNRSAAVTLRNQAEDRQDTAKAQAVKQVASGIRNVGENLLRIDNVPASVADIHKSLAESYVDVGRKLALVPDANGDTAFVAAIEAYNASADTLVKNYITLAGMFSISGVTFTEQDPGSVFTFSGANGL